MAAIFQPCFVNTFILSPYLAHLKEQALSAEIADLIEKANRCDQDEGKAYQEKTGYEIPEVLNLNPASPKNRATTVNLFYPTNLLPERVC
jgi:hypothetical protein